ENNRLVRQGCEALGIRGGAVPTARVDCIGCGWTAFGCAYNRKSSQLITTIPRISKAGGRIYSDARVERIVIENGRAAGVEGSLRGAGAAPARGRAPPRGRPPAPAAPRARRGGRGGAGPRPPRGLPARAGAAPHGRARGARVRRLLTTGEAGVTTG